MGTLEIFNLVAETAQSTVSPTRRLNRLAVQILGFFWNMKARGDLALAAISEELAKTRNDLFYWSYVGSVGNLDRQDCWECSFPQRLDDYLWRSRGCISRGALHRGSHSRHYPDAHLRFNYQHLVGQNPCSRW